MKKPKFAVLYKNFNWKKVKSEEELLKLVKDQYYEIEYLLFNQENPIKGPLCSLVKIDDFDPDLVDLKVMSKIFYNPDDTPRVDYLTMNSVTTPENLSQKMSIFPNLMQISNYNSYSGISGYDTVMDLNIGEITVHTSKKNYKIDLETLGGYHSVKKAFKKCGLYNSPKDCIDEGCYLFLNKHTWGLSSHPNGNPMQFAFVIVPVYEIDTCFILTFEECWLLSQIETIQYTFYSEDSLFPGGEPFGEPFTVFETLISKDESPEMTLETILYGFTNILLLGIAYPDITFSMTLTIGIGPDFYFDLHVTKDEINGLQLFRAVINLMKLGTAQ